MTSIEASWDPQSTSLCGGGLVPLTWSDTAPVTDGEWHQTSPGVAWQIIAKWYTFTLGFTCPTGCPDADVFFDDVELDQAPTAVTVTSFRATATARGIDVSWRTRSNLEIHGFNLFRIQGGNQLKLNRRMIRTRSGRSISESTYRWLDRTAVSKPTYRLQAVLLNGNRRWDAIARAEAVGAVMAPIVLASKQRIPASLAQAAKAVGDPRTSNPVRRSYEPVQVDPGKGGFSAAPLIAGLCK